MSTAALPPRTTGPRRRWRRVLCVVALLLLLLFAWLFWPIQPPRDPLLSRLPADAVLGVELRSPALLWQHLRDEGMIKTTLDLPLGQALRQVLGTPSQPLDRQAQDMVDSIDGLLRAPLGLGMVGRSLSGSLALGMLDVRRKEAILLAKVDNAGWLAVRLALLFRSESHPEVPGYSVLQQAVGSGNARTLYITYAHGLVVAASSPKALQQALSALAGTAARVQLPSSLSPPKEAVLLFAQPDTHLRHALRETLGGSVWPVERIAGVVTRDQRRLHLEVQGELNPHLAARCLANGRARRRTRGAESLAASGRPTIASLPGQAAWCHGYVDPEFAWMTLGKRLWDEPARPQRDSSQPLTVLLWEWLDQSVIAHADGRVAVSLGMPEPSTGPQDDQGVPIAPRFTATWGLSHAAQAATQFRRGLERVIAFYAAPGGSSLYEKVRRQTRLVVQPDGRSGVIELHPLLFNHMQPVWQFDLDHAGFATYPGAFSHAGAALKLDVGTLADLRLGWDQPDAAAAALRAVLADKVVEQALVADPDDQRQIMQTVDLVLGLWRSLPAGEATLTLRHQPSHASGVPRFPLSLTLTTSLRTPQ